MKLHLSGMKKTAANLPVGFFKVDEDFFLSPGGGWRVSFKEGDILEYRADKTMLRWRAGQDNWSRVAPPIQGRTNLDISQYGYGYEQQKMLDAFLDGTTKITQAEALKLVQGGIANGIKELTVAEAQKYLTTLKPTDKVQIKKL